MQLNPFSSRFTNPNDCQFVPFRQVADGESSDEISVAKLAENFIGLKNCAQIVGPHGCGKSTLAMAVARCLLESTELEPQINVRSLIIRSANDKQSVARVGRLQVHETDVSNRTCHKYRTGRISTGSPTRQMLLVDGFELLSPLNQKLMRRQLAANRQYLLLTTHRRLRGIPVLANLQPQLDHFTRIVEQLLSGSECGITQKELTDAFEACRGDYRLALRALYDSVQLSPLITCST